MSEVSPNPQPSGMFAAPPTERAFPTTAVAIASVAIVILATVFVLLGHRHAPPASNNAYAPNLVITNIQMSEADSQLGGKSTYIDGHIANHGTATVTAITTQVAFANDESLPPQLEITPLYLIRTRDPYIDTEPLTVAPLAPGAEADFRLTFENVPANWNTQVPEIHLTQVTTR